MLTRLSGQDFTPVWDKSQMSSGKRFAYLEFPLIMDYQCAFRAEGDPEGIPTKQRLVIRRDQQTGELELFTSLIIPDAGTSRLQTERFSLERPGKFSGRVYLFTPDGQFYRGKAYKDGQQVGTCRLFDQAPALSGTTRSDNGRCSIEYIDGDFLYCVWYQYDNETHPKCQGANSLNEMQRIWNELCEDEDNSSGGGGGGGTGTGDGTGTGEGTGDGSGDGTGDGTGGGTGGGNSESFDYERSINAKTAIFGAQNPENGCAFYCLATIAGGNPCILAEDYFAGNYAHRNWPRPTSGANCDFGPEGAYPEANSLKVFYEDHGVSFVPGQTNISISNVSEMVTYMAGGKGILVMPSKHVYVIYRIRSTNSGNIKMYKYDTNTSPPWTKPELTAINPTGTCHIFN